MKGKFWRSARLPGRGDAAALAVLALAAFFLWNHPDIQETAQHVHILLDDLFSGQFFDFYEHTMQARQAYGFANAAHYHIGFYLLCAVWDLPVYLLGMTMARRYGGTVEGGELLLPVTQNGLGLPCGHTTRWICQ